MDITLKIDQLIDKVVETLAPTLYKEALKAIGGQEKLYELEATSSRLNPENFAILSDVIKNSNKSLKNQILRVLNTELNSLFKEYDVTAAKDKFLKEIEASINLKLNGIPATITNNVIDSVLLTFDNSDIKEIANNLKNAIGGSLKQSLNVLSEALSLKVREKNNEIMLKAEEDGDQYQFSHVIDSKNSAFCALHGNEVRTRKDWINIKSDIFISGGHFGCRGVMVLIPADEVEAVKKEAKK